jgi:hypothetical protein
MSIQEASSKTSDILSAADAGVQTVSFPLRIGEWLPGYSGAIALKHKNGSWSISHSNQVDPTSEWRRGEKVQSGPEMLREGGYVAWTPLELTATATVAPEGVDMAAKPGFLYVGTLSVFEDKEATFGHAYDISTNQKGHVQLQALDGAELYAIRPTTTK